MEQATVLFIVFKLLQNYFLKDFSILHNYGNYLKGIYLYGYLFSLQNFPPFIQKKAFLNSYQETGFLLSIVLLQL